MTELVSVNFEVYGKVQGVFFRKYTREQAKKLGINGYVKNTSKGTVVGTMEGKQSAVNQMKQWLSNTGSPKSRIDKTDFSTPAPVKMKSFSSFDIKATE